MAVGCVFFRPKFILFEEDWMLFRALDLECRTSKLGGAITLKNPVQDIRNKLWCVPKNISICGGETRHEKVTRTRAPLYQEWCCWMERSQCSLTSLSNWYFTDVAIISGMPAIFLALIPAVNVSHCWQDFSSFRLFTYIHWATLRA